MSNFTPPKSASKKSIALFGGSFDPVHKGHVELVSALENLNFFEKIFIIPSKTPPHKGAFYLPEQRRLNMLREAFQNKTSLEISTFELEKPEGTVSYSFNTILHFKKLFPEHELFFVLGTDAFQVLPEWHRFPEVLNLCSFMVVARRGTPFDVEKLEEKELLSQIPIPTPFKAAYKTLGGNKIYFYDVLLPDISSTELRKK